MVCVLSFHSFFNKLASIPHTMIKLYINRISKFKGTNEIVAMQDQLRTSVKIYYIFYFLLLSFNRP